MGKLPPLNALRSFCAVGQHKTITGAASELGVSPSAVSQQIKSLEGWTGVHLFTRGKSSVELTQKGAIYYAQVWQSLNMIGEATNALRGIDAATTNLTVSALPSFASLWLIPRLRGFKALHPEIDISILTTNALVDFSKGDVDIAVRYGKGDYPSLNSRKLMSEAVNIVCTPSALEHYKQQFGSAENLAGLKQVPFVDDVGPNSDFMKSAESWFHSNGLEYNSLNYADRFNDSHMAIENMVSQNMYMLARLSLVEGRLEAGELVAPFGAWTVVSAAYYAVHPEHMPLRPLAKLFVKWLAKECAAWEAETRAIRTKPDEADL